MRAHEAAYAALHAQHDMAATLAAGATNEEAIVVGQVASDAAFGEEGSATMRE